MKKKNLHRLFAVISASVVCVGATAMFAGCTTNRPEVTITYQFNDKTYTVDYILSRSSAPQTVQHFIELADKDYFNGLCIHNYTDTAMYSGGYTYAEDGSLTEKDYFTAVKDFGLTQSVYRSAEGEGMNTLYGEFSKNGVSVEGEKYTHSKGALVMYYTDKGSCNEYVSIVTSGKEEVRQNKQYVYNSATSLFYTYMGEADTSLDEKYCVFGMAKDYATQLEGDDGLITAVNNYIASLTEEETFFNSPVTAINQYDPFEEVRNDIKTTKDFRVPSKPIVIQSVEVTKY